MKAFPRKDAVEIDDKGRHLPQLGMDLRDYFAAQAIQGFLAKGGSTPYKSLCELSYFIADRMMEARNE